MAPFIKRVLDRLSEFLFVQNLWQRYVRQCKGFTCSSNFVTVAGTDETDFLYIRNPSTDLRYAFQEFHLTIKSTSGQSSLWRFYRNPTVTDPGSSLQVQKVLGTCTQTGTALFSQGPEVSNRGEFIQMFNTDFVTFQRMQDLCRFLPAGASLLVTVTGSVANIEHNFNAAYAEEEI